MNKQYVQYGCGLSAPDEWINFDSSPTLRIQRMPLIGILMRPQLNTIFPPNVRYGDIVKGLPLADNSCDGVYCSHVLEHLAMKDFRKALQNTLKIMKPGAVFRCVVPDLEVIAGRYIRDLQKDPDNASIKFIGNGMLMGTEERPRGLRGMLTSYYGNANHLWMWDHHSLSAELKKTGFREIRKARFNDSKDPMFKKVEDESRFADAVVLECIK